MTRKRILVTNVTSDAGASVARELAEIGYEVVGAASTSLPLGLRSRYLRTVHQLPVPTEHVFDQSLMDLVRTVRPDVFLPLGTPEVAAACRQATALRSLTAINIPSHDAFMAAFDHVACGAECAQLGIPCPAAYSLEEAGRLLAEGDGRCTLVIKPHRDVGSAIGVTYVSDPDALRQGVLACTAQFGGAIIQEYIPGGVSDMRTVVLLFDQHGELAAAFTTRKLHHWPPTGGLTALSVGTADFHLVEGVLPFFRKWRWRGAAEVELKFDSRDGQYKVIEINPRFPAYLRFPMTCGLPLARLAASLASGEETTPLRFPSYAVGMKYVNPGLFLRAALADLRSSSAKVRALRQAIADLDGTGPVVSSMLTDPLPVLGRLLGDLGQLLRRRSPG